MKQLIIPSFHLNLPNYCDALAHNGMASLITADVCHVSQNMENYAGLLLPGGGDIDPGLFHQKNAGSEHIDPALDLLQLSMLDLFVSKRKPVLGICKGMQLINIYFGGTLTQDLHKKEKELHAYRHCPKENKIYNVQLPNLHPNCGDQIHKTKVTKDSFLGHLYGESMMTNSAHHQAVNKPGHSIRIIQYSVADHVPEGLCHETLPVFGVQWHPERMCYQHARPELADGRNIFQYFYTQCHD